MSRMKGGGLSMSQATTGLLMMAAGIVLLLDQTGIIEIGSVGRYWPLVLVVIGIFQITAPREKRDVGGGAMMIVFGLWILACTLHWQGLTFRNSWPLVLVAIGVKIVLRALAPVRPAVKTPAEPAAGEESPHA